MCPRLDLRTEKKKIVIKDTNGTIDKIRIETYVR